MRLHPPFIIGPRLLPALRVGDAILSLDGIEPGSERDRATFILDFPDGTSYEDDKLQSGCGGFHGVVEVFETFLSFMEACGDSRQYEIRNRLKFGESENATIFPLHVADWCAEQADELAMLRSDLCDPEDGYTVLTHLIEE